jgi:hypothetical protein
MVLKKMAAALALVLVPLTAAVVIDAPSAYAGTEHMHLITKLDNFFLSISPGPWGPGTIVDVTTDGPDIIEDWELPGNGTVDNAMGYIENANSGMCLETDGVAGHPLYQSPCSGYLLGQVWKISYITNWLGQETYARIINPATQLAADVGGSDRNNNAEVIGWPLNGSGTANQLWSIQFAKYGE